MDREDRGRRLARYRLDGDGSEAALEAGLAEATWFRSDVPRKRMKELMARSDGPAIRDTSLWLGGMIVLGVAGSLLWLSWWCLPIFLAYGILYGSASDSRWHECGHGTAFRTRWMNQIGYQIACFCIMREPTLWRWQHTRHHTDTLIVGRDAEILAMRPARLARILINFVGIPDGLEAFKLMFIHAAGRLTAAETTFVPASEGHKIVRTSRIWLAIYATTVIVAVATWSWLPVVLIGGPRFYGCFLQLVYGVTQHAGMSENVLDHRLNTRSVRMCRINRFVYSNMNYHVEHHMFPMVPYHRLPELHAEIAHDLPEPYPSIWAAYKEIVPAVLRQMKDPTYQIQRQLPDGAAPYHGPVPQPAA
jgi:fatty acid desaturase